MNWAAHRATSVGEFFVADIFSVDSLKDEECCVRNVSEKTLWRIRSRQIQFFSLTNQKNDILLHLS
jgi:hypothetical protein